MGIDLSLAPNPLYNQLPSTFNNKFSISSLICATTPVTYPVSSFHIGMFISLGFFLFSIGLFVYLYTNTPAFLDIIIKL